MREWLTDLLDHARELSPRQWLLGGSLAAVLSLAACDIAKGESVSHTGTVQSRYWFVTHERRCTATDSRGNCTAYMTVTNDHYILVVSHHGLMDHVEVWNWQYYQYLEGSQVQISYWQGGLVGIHWFATVSDPEQDF